MNKVENNHCTKSRFIDSASPNTGTVGRYIFQALVSAMSTAKDYIQWVRYSRNHSNGSNYQ